MPPIHVRDAGAPARDFPALTLEASRARRHHLLVAVLLVAALGLLGGLVWGFRAAHSERVQRAGFAQEVLVDAARLRSASADAGGEDSEARERFSGALVALESRLRPPTPFDELGEGASALPEPLARSWNDVRALVRGLRETGTGSRRAEPAPDRRTLTLHEAEHAVRVEVAARRLALASLEDERRASTDALRQLASLAALLLAAAALAIRVALRRAEQSRAQQALLAQLALVARHSGSAVVVADQGGRVLWANEAFTRLTGWPLAEAFSRPFVELLVAESSERVQQLGGAIQLGHVTHAEVRMRDRAGAELWVALEIVPAGEDALGRRILTFHDVAEARRARLALAASEARFRSALDSMTEGLVIQAPDGAIVACNPAAERILGLTEGQMAGRTSMDPRWRTIHEDGSPLPGSEHPAMIALRTGEGVSGCVMGVHRPDDSHVWISVEANLIRDPEAGAVTGVVTTFLDVTARRHADARLHQLTQAIEQSPTACMITDANRKLEYVNRCFEQMTGWISEDVIGRDPRLLASGQTPRETYAEMWDALQRGERWQGDLLNQRRDGTPFRSRMVVFPLKDGRGVSTHYVALCEDVTEAHRRERELTRAREEAFASARAKSEFLQNMSHELRTPMNGILGMAELLGQGELTSAQRADLATLRNSADQLLTVISQLFDFTRAGAAGAAPHVPFQLVQAIAPVREKLVAGAESRGLAWKFEIAPNVPEAFLGDPGGLRQVLMHLVDNALKFTPRGEVALRADARPIGGNRWQLAFEVRDTGVGIPAERSEKIFEPFEQVDGSSTRRYGGMGLGLTLARLIVTRMEGQMQLASEPGEGSTFVLRVPLEALSGPVLAAGAADPAAPVAGSLAGARVVFVACGGPAHERSIATIEAAGARVDVVPGADGAVSLVREARDAGGVGAIVLDERGGGFEAFALAERLRDALAGGSPPVLLVAMTGQRGDAERCRALGIGAYLAHPVSEADLREALEHLVGPSRGGADAAAALVTRHVLREKRRAVRLLLVEDNPVNRRVATRLLERSGFAVQVAEDGRAGVERFREGGWDVVLMDMQMPVMDGLEATRAIRAWEREKGLERTPIVAVTAHTLDDDRAAATEAGMDGFVTKPISPEQLLQVIHGLVHAAPEEAAADSGPPALAEVLDWDEALDRMDGDLAVLHELLRLFLQDSGHMMQRLEEARASGDLHRIERAAHGLKGASATISARAVAPLAREIESLARAGDRVQALDRMDDLRAEMQRLRRALEALPEAGRRAA